MSGDISGRNDALVAEAGDALPRQLQGTAIILEAQLGAYFSSLSNLVVSI